MGDDGDDANNNVTVMVGQGRRFRWLNTEMEMASMVLLLLGNGLLYIDDVAPVMDYWRRWLEVFFFFFFFMLIDDIDHDSWVKMSVTMLMSGCKFSFSFFPFSSSLSYMFSLFSFFFLSFLFLNFDFVFFK